MGSMSRTGTYISLLVAVAAFSAWKLRDFTARVPPLPESIGKTVQEPVDAIVIGGSHAGLSAAMSLYRHQHTMLIFDDDKPRNSWRTAIRVTSGWEGKDPENYRKISRKEIEATGFARFVNERIAGVERRNDTDFKVTDSRGNEYFGRKILVATGAEFVFPDIEGYEELFPKQILHCMFTFGYEHRGSKSAALLAKGSMGSVKHAMMIAQDSAKFAEQVVMYTDGDLSLAKDLRRTLETMDINAKVDDRKIVRLSKGAVNTEIEVHFEDGKSDIRDFMVHQPSVRPPTWIVNDLDLELDFQGNIKAEGFFHHTSAPGVFAAGDCASPFKIIPNALRMGANAAAGLARELPRSVTKNDVNMLASRLRT